MSTAKIYSASTAAEELGCSTSTVTRWAKRLGVGTKLGRVLILNSREIKAIAKQKHSEPGNPTFGPRGCK